MAPTHNGSGALIPDHKVGPLALGGLFVPTLISKNCIKKLGPLKGYLRFLNLTGAIYNVAKLLSHLNFDILENNF